jgi:hypothetical protein
LRKEYRLRVSENRVLRRIFGPERDEDGSWRKLLHNEFFRSFQYKSRETRFFKPATEKESLHEISNDNGVGVVTLIHKNKTVNSTMFLHRDFYEHTWTSPVGKTQPD